MTIHYHEFRTQSPYLSPFSDDWGVKYRLSGDLLLIYNTGRGRPELQNDRKRRTAIKEFSHGTSNRMARYLRECEADYKYMHTLTYPALYPTDGREVKYHLRRYCQELQRISKRLNRARTSIFWFIEFQSRGAPHFHLLTTDFYSYKRCAMLWYAIVGTGDLKHLRAGVRVEKIKKGKKGMITYARKYARKQEQKEVPEDYKNVGRFYGVYGLKSTVAAAITFYDDLCKKSDILAKKELLNDSIKSLIESGGLALLKQSYGFRMFHIGSISDSYRLMNLMEGLGVGLGESETSEWVSFGESEVSGEVLSSEALEMAKRAYIQASKGSSMMF
jgi:hypothetical protein